LGSEQQPVPSGLRQQRQRESARRKAEAVEAKKRERRRQAFVKADEALAAARHEHNAKISAIEVERAKLDQRAERELGSL
jgi:colicin import membrane protein